MKVVAIERTLTELDHVRITNLLLRHKRGGSASSQWQALERVLDEADIVESREVPPDVVTMYSQVLIEDTGTGQQSTVKLCYPTDADAGTGMLSVLSPVGSSLLGQKLGASVRWTMPGGGEGGALIKEILFQPESSGDFVM